MDLSQFDTRQKAEEGVDLPLEINGEIIHGDDGEPVMFRTKGAVDPEVRKLVMQSMKTDTRTPKEADEHDLKLGRAAITGWSKNFTINGEAVPYSRENIATVLSIPVIRRAILGRIFDEANFMNGS